jgi:hypothetical protein
MNTLRDLLYDLACEAQDKAFKLQKKNKFLVGITKMTEELVDDYLQRFKEENSKYFEWDAK